MNSEELEASLRAEFENYLKNVLSEMRQEVAEFQKKFDADFERQRNDFNKAITVFASRFDSESTFDEAFRSTVAEHLRLAKDEGAKLTANAFAEAEKLDKETAPAGFDKIRDAINDISSQDSQSAILKSLVQQAANFAPRGAFFIIKNDHFVGWKVFGAEKESAEHAIREIHFPVAAESIMGTAIRRMQTVDSAAGAHVEDVIFLDPLEFGRPDRMYALPLSARGKAVAVLYADYGDEGVHLNREALETLVRVAGLTVEMRAGTKPEGHDQSQTSNQFDQESFQGQPTPQPDFSTHHFEAEIVSEPVTEPRFQESIRDIPVSPDQETSTGFSFNEAPEYRPEPVPEFVPEPVPVFEKSQVQESQFAVEDKTENWPVNEPSYNEHQFVEPVTEKPVAEGDMVFDSGGSIETAGFDASPFESTVEEYAPAPASPMRGFEPAVETHSEPTPQVFQAPEPQARLSDRPVDLPIEVPDSERRLHNDARRFARLLVSEIKLYNEKKVSEGREASDLYDRLREAIDRSREMYDKRVQPPVAAKFDYFHYELVNALADGSTERLGPGYPGANV